MDVEIEGHPTPARLSQAASLSQFYFARLFKAMIGDTPIRFFRRRKVMRADEHLAQNPEIDLTVLALKFGYSSQSALTRDSRTLLGFLPGVCRSEFQREKSYYRIKYGNS